MEPLEIGSGVRNSVDLRAMPVEIRKMDESTKQLLDALSESVQLQLKPIEERIKEMLTEIREMRSHHQDIETAQAISEDHIGRLKQDLDRGLASIRKDMSARNKALVPIAAALATLTTVLIGLFLYWIKGAS